MAQAWMILQACHPTNYRIAIDLFYLWNGDFPICIRDGEGLPVHESGWTGVPARDLTDAETQQLNECATDKRKKTFTRFDNKRRYLVVSRGTFPEVER